MAIFTPDFVRPYHPRFQRANSKFKKKTHYLCFLYEEYSFPAVSWQIQDYFKPFTCAEKQKTKESLHTALYFKNEYFRLNRYLIIIK